MFRSVAITVAVVAAAASVVSLSPEHVSAYGRGCFPVLGRFEASPVSPPECTSPVGLCTRGTLTGSLRGTYNFVQSSIMPSGALAVPAIAFYTGDSVITTRRGAQLQGVDTGTLDLDPSRDGAMAALLTFTSGTGYLTGATGQLRLSGNLDFATGQTSGTYRGELCFAHR